MFSEEPNLSYKPCVLHGFISGGHGSVLVDPAPVLRVQIGKSYLDSMDLGRQEKYRLEKQRDLSGAGQDMEESKF